MSCIAACSNRELVIWTSTPANMASVAPSWLAPTAILDSKYSHDKEISLTRTHTLSSQCHKPKQQEGPEPAHLDNWKHFNGGPSYACLRIGGRSFAETVVHGDAASQGPRREATFASTSGRSCLYPFFALYHVRYHWKLQITANFTVGYADGWALHTTIPKFAKLVPELGITVTPGWRGKSVEKERWALGESSPKVRGLLRVGRRQVGFSAHTHARETLTHGSHARSTKTRSKQSFHSATASSAAAGCCAAFYRLSLSFAERLPSGPAGQRTLVKK